MDAFWKDLKYSARLLVRTPAFSVAAIAVLALSMAANIAIFSVVNTVLLKPYGYADPARMVMFQNVFPTGRSGSAAPTEFNWWRQETETFQDVSAYEFNVANWTGESSAEQIPTMRVSADFFRLCGATAVLGRTFLPADDRPHAPRTAVLAHSFWQRRFGGDSGAIGRRMTLSGERYEIIGVAAPYGEAGQITEQSMLSGDIEVHQPPDVYLPLALDPESASHGHFFNVAGRLKPGVSLAAADAQLLAGYAGFVRKWPGIDYPGRGFGIEPLEKAITGGVHNSLLILLSAVGLVLLMACANVANLLLARATGRKREIAIRAALGATRGRIVRQLLTESLMLSTAGSLLGVAGGYAGIRVILSRIPANLPRIGANGSNVSLDWRVAVFTLGLSLLTGMLFGLAPALQSSRTDLRSTSFRHTRTRTALVTAEIALAVVLLIGAALLIRSFVALRQVNPGFDPPNVLTVRMSLAGPQFAEPGNVAAVIHEGVRRIRALPGVEAAATTCCVPLEDRLHGAFRIPGRPDGANSGGLTAFTLVSAGYFETFRIPLIRGRTFTERDESGPPVAIINQSVAKRFWPDRDPLKDQIIMGNGARRQIIGVVGDVSEEALNRDPRPNLYIPSSDGGGISQDQPWVWVIRTRAAPLSLSSAIRQELRTASGGLPMGQIRTMEEIVSRSTAAESFHTLVLTIFGCSALVLAAVGIYGLMSYAVAQRMHEIGIRLALGADTSHIRRAVILQGFGPAVGGMVGGLAAAFGLTRWMASLLYGVTARDAAVFVSVPGILLTVAFCAVWLPALRASHVNPLEALRHE